MVCDTCAGHIFLVIVVFWDFMITRANSGLWQTMMKFFWNLSNFHEEYVHCSACRNIDCACMPRRNKLWPNFQDGVSNSNIYCKGMKCPETCFDHILARLTFRRGGRVWPVFPRHVYIIFLHAREIESNILDMLVKCKMASHFQIVPLIYVRVAC